MNIRYILPVGIFFTIVVITAVAMISILNGDQSRAQLPSPLIGKKAPELVLSSYGSSQTSSDAALELTKQFEDEPFIINFFASWCAPCQKEIPFLEKLSQDVAVIGVAYKDKPDALEIFLERFERNDERERTQDLDYRMCVDIHHHKSDHNNTFIIIIEWSSNDFVRQSQGITERNRHSAVVDARTNTGSSNRGD